MSLARGRCSTVWVSCPLALIERQVGERVWRKLFLGAHRGLAASFTLFARNIIVERLLGGWGMPKDSAAGRRAFEGRMERRRQEGAGEQLRALERGWFLGDEQFRRELLEQVSARPGPRHFGEAVQEASEAQAELARGGSQTAGADRGRF